MYYCFTEKGEVTLPTITELESIINSGLQPVLFIDSCVCIHLVKVVDYKNKAKNIDINSIVQLKEYLSKHSVRLEPFFGLIELCSNKDFFDMQKFNDFWARINFFENCPNRHFKRMQYNFNTDYLQVSETVTPECQQNLTRMLDTNYCALLKICSLAVMGLTKNDAVENINKFTNWLINDLDLMLGFEFQIALKVFGGNTECRKMIGLDSKQEDVKRKLIGSSWDMFNARYATNTKRLKYLLNEDIYGFFVTSDKNLYEIFRNNELRIIKNGADICDDAFVFTSDYDLPHLDQSDIKAISTKNMRLFADRGAHVFTRNSDVLDGMIAELEVLNGIA